MTSCIYGVKMRLHCLPLVVTRQTMAPFFTGSYKVKVCSGLCILLFFPPLAQTSVYSNIIFCEVSWGEKQFGHSHCYLIRRLCWMQQTPRVTVLSILETPDIGLISSPFYLQASLITPAPSFFFFSSSPPFSDKSLLASFPTCSPHHWQSYLLPYSAECSGFLTSF